MRRISLYVRVVLLIAVGAVVAEASVRGGEPPDASGAHPERYHPAHSAQPGTAWAPQVPPVQPTPVQPVRDYLRKVNAACWSHHSVSPGCSSLWAELRFGFGSCRSWFGEACPGDAPAVPLPGGGYGKIPGAWNTRCPGCP